MVSPSLFLLEKPHKQLSPLALERSICNGPTVRHHRNHDDLRSGVQDERTTCKNQIVPCSFRRQCHRECWLFKFWEYFVSKPICLQHAILRMGNSCSCYKGRTVSEGYSDLVVLDGIVSRVTDFQSYFRLGLILLRGGVETGDKLSP